MGITSCRKLWIVLLVVCSQSLYPPLPPLSSFFLSSLAPSSLSLSLLVVGSLSHLLPPPPSLSLPPPPSSSLPLSPLSLPLSPLSLPLYLPLSLPLPPSPSLSLPSPSLNPPLCHHSRPGNVFGLQDTSSFANSQEIYLRQTRGQQSGKDNNDKKVLVN